MDGEKIPTGRPMGPAPCPPMGRPLRQPILRCVWRQPTQLALVVLCLFCAATAAPAPGVHAHGAAELRVVVDGEQLEVTLDSPLDNVLGFEHVPRNDKQRAAVRALATKLRQAQALFVPTAAAQCRLTSVQLASSVLPADLLGEAKPTATPAGPAAADHADLGATFTFKCATPALLKGMEVLLIAQFPGLRKLDAQVVGPQGQSATQLTPVKRVLNWSTGR